MTTKQMTWICSWCRSKNEMNVHTLIYNFTDESYADPIGYCSVECVEHAKVAKESILRKAGILDANM